jgi:hypothetical protein
MSIDGRRRGSPAQWRGGGNHGSRCRSYQCSPSGDYESISPAVGYTNGVECELCFVPPASSLNNTAASGSILNRFSDIVLVSNKVVSESEFLNLHGCESMSTSKPSANRIEDFDLHDNELPRTTKSANRSARQVGNDNGTIHLCNTISFRSSPNLRHLKCISKNHWPGQGDTSVTIYQPRTH